MFKHTALYGMLSVVYYQWWNSFCRRLPHQLEIELPCIHIAKFDDQQDRNSNTSKVKEIRIKHKIRIYNLSVIWVRFAQRSICQIGKSRKVW